ncbi:DNRLRE domain-containing protein [Nocardioides acrostichi]|uniref:DNRLRE domain-containing protein n=1 Tax=Nocardioides acrostichi TaxID=2784339 RepID=UPI001A9C309C|nr:DNRLRE domain-containing protein [Nocardioides acrostichi]
MSYSYDVAASAGVVPSVDAAGDVVFTDTTDATAGPNGDGVVFTIPRAFMVDSAVPEPAYTDAVDYAIDPATDSAGGSGTGWVLTMTPDTAWLGDAARVYPVSIDPTTTLGSISTVRDCWLQAGSPTTSRCGDNSRYLRVGRDSSNSRHRDLLDFDLSAIPGTATITGASVNLTVDETQTRNGNNSNYKLLPAGKTWTDQATWATSGSNGSWTGGDPDTTSGLSSGPVKLPEAYGGYCTSGTCLVNPNVSFDAKDLVTAWFHGARANTGLVLLQSGENTNNQISFYSASSQNASGKRPQLSVTYDEGVLDASQAGDRSFFTYVERDLSDKITAKVNVGNGNLFVSAQDATMPGIAGWDMDLTRYYNSANESWGGAKMGAGWSTPFGGSMRLEFPRGQTSGLAQKVDFYGPTGERTRFDTYTARTGQNATGAPQLDQSGTHNNATGTATGTYLRPHPGINADLFYYDNTTTGIWADDVYKLKWFDESFFLFDADGRLMRTEDANGNKLTFSYASTGVNSGDLDHVTDTRGRTAQLHYNASGLVDWIEFRKPDGTMLLRWAYEYTNTAPAYLSASYLAAVNANAIGSTAAMTSTTGNGQDVTGNVGARTTYTYGGNRKLASITNARENTSGGSSASSNGSGKGQVMSFDYDGDGHVTTWTRPNTNPNSTASGDQPGPSKVTFFYHAGHGTDVTSSSAQPQDACKPSDWAASQDSPAAARTILTGERDDTNNASTIPGQSNQGTIKTKYCVDELGRVLRTTDAKDHTRSSTWTANSNVQTADMTGTGTGQQQYQYNYNDSSTDAGGDGNPDTADSATSPEGGRATAQHEDEGHPYSTTKTGQNSANSSNNSKTGDTTQWNYAYDDWNNLIQAESSQTSTDRDVRYRYCWTTQGQIARIDPIVATGSVTTNSGMSTKAPNSSDRKSSRGDSNNSASCLAATGVGTDNDTVFSYNANGDLTSVDKPAGGDESYIYDAMSRLATVTDARGVTTTYKYDALDHVVSAAHSKSGQTTQTVAWAYDLAGNQTRLSSLNDTTSGGANTFTYDRLNQLASESGQAVVGKIEYTYDPAGNLSRQKVSGQVITGVSDASTTSYTYDKVNLLATLSDPRGRGYTFNYDAKDKLTKTTYPRLDSGGGDVVAKANYDNDGNPTCMWSYLTATSGANGPSTSNGCPGASADGLYTYRGYNYVAGNGNHTSNIQKMTELGGAVSSYSYDNIDRLTAATTKNSSSLSATTIRDFAYDYDRHSNLTKTKATGTTPGMDTRTLWSAFNAGDEICASQHLAATANNPNLSCSTSAGSGTNGVAKYNHDQAGNLTTATGGGDLAGLDLAYNLPGQTTSITAPGSTTAQAQAYDGVMQDRRTTSGPTQMAYGFSGLTNQSTNATAPGGAHGEIFVRTPGGDLLAMIDTSSGQARYYMLDHQKSVIATVADRSTPTPSIGGEVTRYLYEPYGTTIRTWNDTTPGDGNNGSENGSLTAPSADNNPYGYASGYTDRQTGLVKFGTRFYVPGLGTWTQQDPKSGAISAPLTLNSFDYATRNPVNKTDRNGRYSVGVSIEGCYYVCVSVGYSEDSEGNRAITGGLGAGSPGVSAGVTASTSDLETGISPSVGCSAGPATISTSGSDVSGSFGTSYSTPMCSASIEGAYVL